MRQISATMATQHPDNAGAPYWDSSGNPFVGVHMELKDCMASFRDLGVREYMWDWEGKYADSAVVDKMFSNYHEYFSKYQLGRDRFLTFRIPNIWEERGYSLLQAMTVALTSEDFSRDLKFASRPLFEVILPMTERAEQLMQMHQSFEKLARFKSQEFDTKSTNDDYLEIIPLVESVDGQQHIGRLLHDYTELHQAHFGRRPAYIRPFLARSDPALISGLLATVLANKVALSQIYDFSSTHNIPVFPIAGVGGLPFRGGLTPDTVAEFAANYPGVRTASVQSSFRFDYPRSRVQAAVAALEKLLPRTTPLIVSPTDQARLAKIIALAAANYQSTLRDIVGDLSPIIDAIPRRRERRQHIGLLAYQRSLGTLKLPRAITFTAAFYSIGIPPEFVGVGRTLQALSESDRQLLLDVYPSLAADLSRAGRYLNTDNLATMSRRNSAWKQVAADVSAAQSVLSVTFGPQTQSEQAHRNLTSNVLLLKNNPSLPSLITETAVLRKSLG